MLLKSKKLSLTAVLALLGATIVAPTAWASTPAYYPSGPQNDVLITDVTSAGWEVCYQGNYADSQALYGAGGLLSELCTGDHLMLAGSFPADPTKYAALAAAPRADVLFDTGTDRTTTHAANGTNWYFNNDWSWGFVDAGEMPDKNQCDIASDGKPKSLCWHMSESVFFDGYLLAGVAVFDSISTRVVLQASAVPAPAPYSGPLPTNYSDRTPAVGDAVVVSGLRLSSITSCTIDGVTAAMSNQSEDSFTIAIPSGLEPGVKDLVITSSAGTLTVQDAFTVTSAAEDSSESVSAVSAKGWTKKLTDSTAKIYAKDLVGAGKVQIFFNGKEIAWVNATSESDSKLRTANGAHYLVRTVELVKGQKNILEVHLDGIRIKRVAYSY